MVAPGQFPSWSARANLPEIGVSSSRAEISAIPFSIGKNAERPETLTRYSAAHFHRLVNASAMIAQGFAKVFSSSPSPPQKRVKECVAGLALPRQTGNTLFMNLGGGLAAKQSNFCETLTRTLTFSWYLPYAF